MTSTTSGNTALPLAGIQVLDLSAYIAGPYGCTLLADLGAEVIKIEPPEGDNLRKYPSTLEAESRAFIGVNRGKRGISLDLKSAEGYDIFLTLLHKADVLVHNFRPTVPPRLKIDFQTLSQLNPRLVYCAMTGYGSTGPMANNAGYDQVLQAMSGICDSQGMGKAEPEIVYGSVVDFYASAMIANSVNAALFKRERTGEGSYVEVSLLASALTMQSTRLVWAEGEPKNIERDMRSGGITGIHPTKDGFIYLSANTPHFWEALCSLLGLASLASDERYDTVRKRAEQASVIVPIIRDALQQRSAAEWETHFGTRVPCAMVRPVHEMFDHPQVQAEGMVREFSHSKIGKYKSITGLIKMNQAPCATARAAPDFGQHTSELLAEYGYSEQEIDLFRARGIVR
ncbi:CaiB/BaiF CoA transferase family protein [Advenella mimigardefordensis]|uniref:Putative acyl-CoA transferase family 3 n=1 Tax=Advenella mimigardefordensis (strain DSM 17166 / LMG 22922 / DPN7) TaxID=1247726 RepID=W0PJT0_ADVMD|nr:CoA transferase [Advenella mimigardefordensis]AHG65810.1 putative acyl-CoA transferase family 3 [Advenella mimigardefordensis DPN7]